MKTNEVDTFYNALLQDIRSEQLAEAAGGMLEQLFTKQALNLLTEGGETENFHIAYHENIIPRNRHKINAYAIHDNYETIDLFITIFKCSKEITKISKNDIEDAAKLIINFFQKARSKEYTEELEESSEIFDFAHTISDSLELRSKLVRINATIITDGVFSGKVPVNNSINNIPFFLKVVDINYLYNISEKSYTSIEINFKSDGYKIPCIIANPENKDYQSYLAIIPGEALVDVYERFGARLLEQNVRSFLQFNGKINKGIKHTILKEPHMFLAFNNGIAATANSLELEKTSEGIFITSINNLQIVNGGQTTASIYHTAIREKADISKVFVQLKLSVIENREDFGLIVGRIAEYANTQNKISISDLSSNTPYHIGMEKLSRSIWAPPLEGQLLQTRWFYERARGQYKNARINEGTTKAKQKDFDVKTPRSQFFTKEELAKYINSYGEIHHGKKMVVGPHMVVRGGQKNYVQFIQYNLSTDLDSKYYEEFVAKAILFRSIEKAYGIKPNAIGDMRYITVPYSIAWLTYNFKHKIDLSKIWKAQSLSSDLKEILYKLMIQIEDFIKKNAPGALYGEWAKKQECWEAVRAANFNTNFLN